MRIFLLLLLVFESLASGELLAQKRNLNKYLAKLDWVDAKEHIYPQIIKSKTANKSEIMEDTADYNTTIAINYIYDLQIIYVVEIPDYMIAINKALLNKWNVSLDSLQKVSLDNLNEFANNTAVILGDSNFAMITLNGVSVTSLILTDKFFSSHQQLGKLDNLIIGIPKSKMLFLSHSDSALGLEKMRSVIKAYFSESQKSLSNWIYIKGANGWTQYEKVE